MKKYNLLIVMLLFVAAACSTQNRLPEAYVTSLLKSREFSFMAERAYPSNADVINVINSIPNASSRRMLDLDSGYGIDITKDKITVTLPYFGRMYNPSIDPQGNSYRFSSKNFIINETDGKKGSTLYRINTKDRQQTRVIYLEVFKGGSATVAIDSNDRQTITYTGYIAPLETKQGL